VIRHRTGDFDTAETEVISAAEGVVRTADAAFTGKEK